MTYMLLLHCKAGQVQGLHVSMSSSSGLLQNYPMNSCQQEVLCLMSGNGGQVDAAPNDSSG